MEIDDWTELTEHDLEHDHMELKNILGEGGQLLRLNPGERPPEWSLSNADVTCYVSGDNDQWLLRWTTASQIEQAIMFPALGAAIAYGLRVLEEIE